MGVPRSIQEVGGRRVLRSAWSKLNGAFEGRCGLGGQLPDNAQVSRQEERHAVGLGDRMPGKAELLSEAGQRHCFRERWPLLRKLGAATILARQTSARNHYASREGEMFRDEQCTGMPGHRLSWLQPGTVGGSQATAVAVTNTFRTPSQSRSDRRPARRTDDAAMVTT